MRTIKLIILLLSLSALTNAHAVAVSQTLSENKLAVIVVNSDKPEFTITLKRNATTGYVWLLKNPENYKFVEQMGYHYQVSDSNLVGSGGEDQWTFRVRPEYFKAPVTFQLQFIYVRPWELKPSHATTFDIVTAPHN